MGFQIDKHKTDSDKAINGVWIDYLGGSKVLVARHNNKNAEKARLKLAKDHNLHLMPEGEDLNKQLEAFDTQVLAECVLLDWEDIEDLEGNPIEATVENRLHYLTEIEDFRDDIVRLASNRDRYHAEADTSDAEAVKK